MSAKGKVMGDDLRQIAEQVPQIRQIMVDAFGTADTEILQKAGITANQYISLVSNALSKLPTVTGGIANDLENISDSAEKSLARIGDAVARVAGPPLQKLADAADTLSRRFSELPRETQDAMVVLGAIAAGAGPVAMLANQFIELSKAIGLSRMAIVGPAGLIGAVTLLGGLKIADLMNEDSARKEVEAARSAYETFSQTLTEKQAQLKAAQAAFDKAKGSSFPGDIAFVQEAAPDLNRLKQEVADLERRTQLAFLNIETKKNLNAPDPEFEQAMQDYAQWALQQDARQKIQRVLHEREQEEARKHADALLKIRLELQAEVDKLTLNQYDFERLQMQQKLKEAQKAGVSEVEIARWKTATLSDIAKRQFEAALGDLEAMRRKGEERADYQAQKLVESMLVGHFAASDNGLTTIYTPVYQDMGKSPDKYQSGNLPLLSVDAGRKATTDRYFREMQESVQQNRREDEEYKRQIATFASQLSEPVSDAVNAGLNGGNAVETFAARMRQTLSSMFSELFSNQVKNLLKHAFTDLTTDLQTSLAQALGRMRGIMQQIAGFLQSQITELLSATYALIAASQRKKQFGIGSILGAVGGFLLGGPTGAIAGYNVGNALDNHDYTGAVIGIATGTASGAFNNGPTFGTHDLGEIQPSGSQTKSMPSRAVQVTVTNYGGVHNLGGLDQMTAQITGAVQSGLRIVTG
jgi:hypothetical protein